MRSYTGSLARVKSDATRAGPGENAVTLAKMAARMKMILLNMVCPTVELLRQRKMLVDFRVRAENDESSRELAYFCQYHSDTSL